jgi:hypothetical protein
MAGILVFVPAARSLGLVVTEAKDGVLVYDRARHATHHLSPLATAIWNSCDGWRTVDDLCRFSKYALGMPINDDSVLEALALLDRADLLEQPLVPAHG